MTDEKVAALLEEARELINNKAEDTDEYTIVSMVIIGKVPRDEDKPFKIAVGANYCLLCLVSMLNEMIMERNLTHDETHIKEKVH